MTPDRRTLLALFAIALGLRLLYAAVISTDPSINPNPITFEYSNAETIAAGSGWVGQAYSPLAPGFSVLLGAAFAILGAKLWVAWLLQAILGAITVLVVYRFGEKRLGKTVGLFSALWLAIYVHQMHYASLVMRDVLATTLFVMLVYLLAQPFYRMRNAVWTGLLYTLLVHTDPQYLLLAPVIVVYMLVMATRQRLLNLQYVFVFLMAAFVFSLPWTVRNLIVYHEFVPVGLESKRYVGRVINLISADTWDPKLPANQQAARFKSPGPIRNTIEFWRVTRFGSKDNQGAWSLRHNLINLVNYGLMLPLLLFGVYTAFRQRNRGALFLTGTLLVYFLIHVKYGGGGRARLPAEPMIILLAFYGATNLIGSFRAKFRPHDA